EGIRVGVAVGRDASARDAAADLLLADVGLHARAGLAARRAGVVRRRIRAARRAVRDVGVRLHADAVVCVGGIDLAAGRLAVGWRRVGAGRARRYRDTQARRRVALPAVALVLRAGLRHVRLHAAARLAARRRAGTVVAVGTRRAVGHVAMGLRADAVA